MADDWQGRGLGTLLLGRIVTVARQAGIGVLTAVVLPENHAMIQVFRDSGFPVHVRAEPGELQRRLRHRDRHRRAGRLRGS